MRTEFGNNAPNEWIQLPQGNHVMGSLKREKFLDWLSDYQLLK
jgi:hypothetical protein